MASSPRIETKGLPLPSFVGCLDLSGQKGKILAAPEYFRKAPKTFGNAADASALSPPPGLEAPPGLTLPDGPGPPPGLACQNRSPEKCSAKDGYVHSGYVKTGEISTSACGSDPEEIDDETDQAEMNADAPCFVPSFVSTTVQKPCVLPHFITKTRQNKPKARPSLLPPAGAEIIVPLAQALEINAQAQEERFAFLALAQEEGWLCRKQKTPSQSPPVFAFENYAQQDGHRRAEPDLMQQVETQVEPIRSKTQRRNYRIKQLENARLETQVELKHNKAGQIINIKVTKKQPSSDGVSGSMNGLQYQ